MKHYIQIFETPSAGDNYKIKDIPFMCSVESTGQNLVCNEEDKRLINVNGILVIDDIPPITKIYLTGGTIVEISDSALTRSIISDAVDNDGDIEKIEVGNNVIEINDEECFASFRNLTGISIGSAVVTINTRNCLVHNSPVESIVVDSNNPYYDSRNNCNAIVESSNNEIICGCKTTVIQDDIVYVGSNALRGCAGLTLLTIPSGITNIGISAFTECNNLTSVPINFGHGCVNGNAGEYFGVQVKEYNIICSVSSIDTSFSDLTQLEKITLYGAHNLINGAFAECTSLSSVTIDTCYLVPYGAFYGCTSLTDLSLRGIGIIYSWSFQNCTSLTDVTIPHTVSNIYNRAFNACSKLTGVTIDSQDVLNNAQFDADNGLNGLFDYYVQEFVFGEHVTSLPYAAFAMASVENIVIPRTIISISSGVFVACNNITGITVSPDNPKYDSRNGSNCIVETSTNKLVAGFVSTIIPLSVTSIGEAGFSSLCIGYTQYPTIPSSITSIGYAAFYVENDYNDIVLNIPNTVTSIGSDAFKNIKLIEYCGSATGMPWGAQTVICNGKIIYPLS